MFDAATLGDLQKSTARFTDLNHVRSYILFCHSRYRRSIRRQSREWTSIHLALDKHYNETTLLSSIIYCHNSVSLFFFLHLSPNLDFCICRHLSFFLLVTYFSHQDLSDRLYKAKRSEPRMARYYFDKTM